MGLIRFLFSKYKYLLYSAFGNEEYFEVTNQLKEHGISFETVRLRNQSFHQSISQNWDVQYDLFVQEVDVHKAQQAILQR